MNLELNKTKIREFINAKPLHCPFCHYWKGIRCKLRSKELVKRHVFQNHSKYWNLWEAAAEQKKYDKGTFQCPRCPSMFVHERNLKRHIATKHWDLRLQIFKENAE